MFIGKPNLLLWPLKSRSGPFSSSKFEPQISYWNKTKVRKFRLIYTTLAINSTCSSDWVGSVHVHVSATISLTAARPINHHQLFDYLSNTITSIILGHPSIEIFILEDFNVLNQYWLNNSLHISREERTAETFTCFWYFQVHRYCSAELSSIMPTLVEPSRETLIKNHRPICLESNIAKVINYLFPNWRKSHSWLTITRKTNVKALIYTVSTKCWHFIWMKSVETVL